MGNNYLGHSRRKTNVEVEMGQKDTRMEIKGKSIDKDSIYQVVWGEDEKNKLLASHSDTFDLSSKGASLATHEIDIHHSTEFKSKSDHLLVREDIIGASEHLQSHMVDDENSEEQIITEISSAECIGERRRRKSKRGKREDHPYVSKDSSPVKCLKIKKEKDDVTPTVRKRFSQNWFHLPEFSRWLEESPIPGYAFCNVCRKDLLPGKSELQKHSSTAKHKRKIDAIGLGTKDDPMSHRTVDLRSDTVTTPNREMREAMKNAVVGDSAFGEDPTVQELEAKVAKLMDMQTGLFVPSGTMGNLICVLTHCWSRGSLVIIGDQSRMYRGSQGGISEIGNVSQRVVRNLPDGSFKLSDLQTILRTHGPNWPTTTLVCIENAHQMMGGKAVPIEWLDSLGDLCGKYEIPIHLDGARLINASAALGTSLPRLARHCSSATFCLSKGLGAPGGSVITGTAEFIQRAALVRKSLGGIIHQAGVLAAACLYGLNSFVSRIPKDHSNARAIAKAVCGVNSSAITVDVNNVQTNIVHLICDNIRVNPVQLCERLGKVIETEAVELSEGVVVKCMPIEPNIVRIMTHGDLQMEDVRATIRKLQYVISEYDNYFVIQYENC